ncbi:MULTISPECIES: hypothetical protein [unclassified Endozoicomonas]|nr:MULTISPECIES: hypothetical protein [unclassified Endozoicomonas]
MLLLSVVCRAEPLTGHFIVEGPCSCGIKTALFESISLQSLHATNLLVGYEPILTSRDSPLNSSSCSWLPIEMALIVSWLLKNCRNPDLPLLNPIEQQELISALTLGDCPFETMAMMHGSGDKTPQYPPSESSGQQVPEANIQPIGFFTSLLYSDFGDGNGDPQQYSHTLGLHCFVHPCHGFCQFGPSVATSPESSCYHSLNERCLVCKRHFGPGNAIYSMSAGSTYTNDPNGPAKDDVPVSVNKPVSADDQVIIDGLLCLSDRSLPEKNGISCTTPHFTDSMGASASVCPPTCDVRLVENEVQQPPCGKVCKNAHVLSERKRRERSRQRSCSVPVVRKAGRPEPCGKVCKSAYALSGHKRREHSGQRTCGVTVIGEDGRPRPCGVVCKHIHDLSEHKRKEHSSQKICDETVVGEDGQSWPCGVVCRNAHVLTNHKIREHSRQKTCDVNVLGEDGQPRPCGHICKNRKVLSDHKVRLHKGQKTCDVIVIVRDGQLRPCGTVCKNPKALSTHKSEYHTGQKTCSIAVIGEDGQQRPCGRVFRNARALSDHKKQHRKRKPVHVNQNDAFTSKEVEAKRVK